MKRLIAREQRRVKPVTVLPLLPLEVLRMVLPLLPLEVLTHSSLLLRYQVPGTTLQVEVALQCSHFWKAFIAHLFAHDSSMPLSRTQSLHLFCRNFPPSSASAFVQTSKIDLFFLLRGPLCGPSSSLSSFLTSSFILQKSPGQKPKVLAR